MEIPKVLQTSCLYHAQPPPSTRNFPSHHGLAFPTSAARQTKEGLLDTNSSDLSQATSMNSPNIHKVSYRSQTFTKLHGFKGHLNVVNPTSSEISQQHTCLATPLSVLVYPFFSGICRREPSPNQQAFLPSPYNTASAPWTFPFLHTRERDTLCLVPATSFPMQTSAAQWQHTHPHGAHREGLRVGWDGEGFACKS